MAQKEQHAETSSEDVRATVRGTCVAVRCGLWDDGMASW
jgi:hypothetical protein